MPDSTLDAIDRVFDFIDKGVDVADHALNRGKRTAEQHHGRRAKRSVIDAQAVATKVSTKTSVKEPVKTTVVARRPHFYIVEASDPKSGAPIFVVTDGGNARTECSSREFANQILRSLEKAP